MSVFADKKFEELDWISQATEPIDSELNVMLGELPDELAIDYNLLIDMIGESYSLELTKDRIISWCVDKYCKGRYLSWSEREILTPCFELQMEGEPTLNFETKTLDGEIKLVKIQNTMDEKVLESLLGRQGIEILNQMYMPNDGLSRANEVMELLGKCEQGLRTRSHNKKRVMIRQRLTQIMKTNEWKIKDTELANKVGNWIYNYIMYGNLAAWSNFCRLKVMTHKEQAIYSMEEVK